MTERRGDQGFSVAPRAVDGGGASRRRGPRRIGVVVVVLASVALIAVGWLGPQLDRRPSLDIAYFATPTPSGSRGPSPSPSPTLRPDETPSATPLPRITLANGEPPAGHIAMVSDHLRVLDLRTGDVAEGPTVDYGGFAVRASAAGGWRCICSDTGNGTSLTRTIRDMDLDPSAGITRTTDLLTLPAIRSEFTGQYSVGFDLDLAADGRKAILATGTRSGLSFAFDLRTVDLDADETSPPVAIGTITIPRPPPTPTTAPSPTPTDPGAGPTFPPDEAYLDGPHIRLAPDGRTAFVWGFAQRVTNDTSDPPVGAGWRVELRPDGSIGAVTDAPAVTDMPAFCTSVGFATGDRLVMVCPTVDDLGNMVDPFSMTIHVVGLDGRTIGSVALSATSGGYGTEPLFDRANGRVYVWDPINLTLDRVDIAKLTVDRTKFDAAATAGPGGPSLGGQAPAVWADADSAIQLQTNGQLAGSTDGERLYALGFTPGAEFDGGSGQASAGVFVIDRSTLALIAHWAPVANDSGIAVLPDGRIATAAQPGYDVEGRVVPWAGSLALHDAVDGRILARYGQVSADSMPTIVDR
jgi:hypothetical protein